MAKFLGLVDSPFRVFFEKKYMGCFFLPTITLSVLKVCLIFVQAFDDIICIWLHKYWFLN